MRLWMSLMFPQSKILFIIKILIEQILNKTLAACFCFVAYIVKIKFGMGMIYKFLQIFF